MLGMIQSAKARLVALLIAVLAIVIVGWMFRETIALALQGHSKARLSAVQAKAAAQSARDAIEATGAVSARSGASDALTRENENAIRAAPGAAAPVDPALRDAGLLGLCRRAAYRGDPKCVRFTAAR